MRETDQFGRMNQFGGGFTWSPSAKLLFRARYRWRESSSDFDHSLDIDEGETPGNGYPAFIRSRGAEGGAGEFGLTWRVSPRFRPSFKWQRRLTEYELETTDFAEPWGGPAHPGGEIITGTYSADVYSFSLGIVPWSRLSFSSTLSYSDSATTTLQSLEMGLHPFVGDSWHGMNSLTFVLGSRTDLTLSHSFYSSDYGDRLPVNAIRYGLNAERHSIITGIRHKVGQVVSLNVQYGWFDNDEPSSNGVNDYSAQMIMAILSLDWP